ncbi:transcriptional regulator [Salmonella enterica subsp. enterica]|uniref:Transcriptional regulator n=1 Tax=Salmonella enterica I TaxID=59201 RepID=A0A3S5DMB0_SALET|nr:transcriptional regulator [Salmonella enterica subsp. enterica]
MSLAWKAQQLIRTHYHLPLSSAVLAKELHCNVDYLGRVYRRVFHLTLTESHPPPAGARGGKVAD